MFFRSDQTYGHNVSAHDAFLPQKGFAVPVRYEQPRREPEAAPAGIDQGHRNHRQGGQDPEKGNDDKRDTVNRAESVGLHFRIGSSLAEQRAWVAKARASRSEEHTSELQSLMRNSYADFR